MNPNFANVSVECSVGFAYQSSPGGGCTPGSYQQNFNGSVGIGWLFGTASKYGDGLSKPNTTFEPPPFAGVSFTQAAFLQSPSSAIEQTIPGFVPGGHYTLSFYLGSRYASGSYDGNQTVEALIDGQVIGTWNLVSYTPFTLETANFTVTTGGPHTLTFMGMAATGDHTAFFSGVSIETTSSLTVSPSSAFPGVAFGVSASGFAPNETVYLVGFSSAIPALIGGGKANASGNATLVGRIPQTPFGTYGMQAVGASSKAVVSGTVGIIPQILITPTTAAIGSTVSAEGFGFASDEVFYIALLNPSTLLGGSITNGYGTSAAVPFTIPSTASVGANTVLVIGQRSGAIASAQITVE